MNSRLVMSLLVAVAIALAVYIFNTTSYFSKFANAGGSAKSTQLVEHQLTQLGTIQDRRLTEISGIDASVRYADCYWVHNDSGNPAEIFLISSKGETKAVVSLAGAKNQDWEDICVGQIKGKSYICVGDVGDNAGRRASCQLYLFEEPELTLDGETESPIKSEVSDFKVLEFTYADGPRNCEAIAFDSRTRSIFLIQKATDRNESAKLFGVYQLRIRPSLKLLSKVANRVAEIPNRLTTGAAISEDSKQLLLCDYTTGYRMKRAPTADWVRQLQSETAKFEKILLPIQRQGEAICFGTGGKSAVVASEFGKQPIWKIDLQLPR